MKRIVLLISWLILIHSLVLAQDEEFKRGSPYSVFGVGDLELSTGVRTESMGILGLSLPGAFINSLNATSNSDLPMTKISIGLKYGFLRSSTSTSDFSKSDGDVTGINIGIPLWKEKGLTLTAGFNPYSQINYKITNLISLADLTYKQSYSGSGHISKINFGFSVAPINFITIGASFNYNFGSITSLKYLDFSSQYINNTYIRKENNLNGINWNGGMRLNFGALGNNQILQNLTLGLFYQTKLELTSDVETIYATSVGFDTTRNYEITTSVPVAYGVGFSKQFGKQTILAGDILIQNWSSFIPFGQTTAEFSNSYRAGIGIEILPAIKFDKTFFESLTYRFGISWGKEYYTIKGENIKKFGLALGINIPLDQYNSIDLGVSYSIRGKEDVGIVKEQYLKFSAAINFGERWFIKSREE
ncbi:MAG: hypothetical protein ACP5P3_00060 [Ignavibacteria bacterium]